MSKITFYVEHDAGSPNDWPDWQEVDEETFCALANEYKVDFLGTFWEVRVTQNEKTKGLRLMLCAIRKD